MLIVVASACGGGDDTTTTAGGDVTTTAPTGSSGSEVIIQELSFEPNEITVQAGDTVTWKNMDSPSHTATSSDDLWDSDTISPGGEFSFTFDEPGTYAYFCRFHGTMTGTVVVEG